MSDEWVTLGEFGVDSGQFWISGHFWIGDPMWIDAEPCNSGVIGSAGLGDGRYTVSARMVDVGGGDMRIAELRVVFVTDADIR